MEYSLLKDNVVVGHVATTDPDFAPPEGFALAPMGPVGHVWTSGGFVPPIGPFAEHALLHGAFDASECALILRMGAALPLEAATVRSTGTGGKAYRPRSRRSSVGWFRPGDPDIDPVFAKIWTLVQEQNARLFDAAIERIPELQFTRYEAATAGHFDWHADAGIVTPDGFERRLSFVLMLSDPDAYEGGRFELDGVGEIGLRAGSALIFRSAQLHRVTPVTAGTRHSLVAWVEGR